MHWLPSRFWKKIEYLARCIEILCHVLWNLFQQIAIILWAACLDKCMLFNKPEALMRKTPPSASQARSRSARRFSKAQKLQIHNTSAWCMLLLVILVNPHCVHFVLAACSIGSASHNIYTRKLSARRHTHRLKTWVSAESKHIRVLIKIYEKCLLNKTRAPRESPLLRTSAQLLRRYNVVILTCIVGPSHHIVTEKEAQTNELRWATDEQHDCQTQSSQPTPDPRKYQISDLKLNYFSLIF